MDQCEFIYNKTTDTNPVGTRCRNSKHTNEYCIWHRYTCEHGIIDISCKKCMITSYRRCNFVYKNKRNHNHVGNRCENKCTPNMNYCYIHKYTCRHGIRKNNCCMCKVFIKKRLVAKVDAAETLSKLSEF